MMPTTDAKVAFLDRLGHISNHSTWTVAKEAGSDCPLLRLGEKSLLQRFGSGGDIPTLCAAAETILDRLTADDFKDPELIVALDKASEAGMQVLQMLAEKKDSACLQHLKAHFEQLDAQYHFHERSLRLHAEERLNRLLDEYYGDLPKFPGDDIINKQAIKELVDKTAPQDLDTLSLPNALGAIQGART